MRRNRILTLMLALSAALSTAAAAAPLPSGNGDPGRMLDQIVRLTSGGFSEQTVLAYLKARRADIPPILTAEDFSHLRRAGVSEAVIGYLSGAAAIELDTAGRSAEMDAEPASELPTPEPTYVAPAYGWPAYGGGYIGSPLFFPRGHFHRQHGRLTPQPFSMGPRIGPNGFPILAPPGAPGGSPLPIGANGFPVLSRIRGIP